MNIKLINDRLNSIDNYINLFHVRCTERDVDNGMALHIMSQCRKISSPLSSPPHGGGQYSKSDLNEKRYSEIIRYIDQNASSVEVLSHIPDAKQLAKLISAFSNVGGGSLLIGVSSGAEILGTDVAACKKVFEKSLGLLDEAVRCSYIILRDKRGYFVFLINIQDPGGEIIFLRKEGVAYQRSGNMVEPIKAEIIKNKLFGPFENINHDQERKANELMDKIELLRNIYSNNSHWSIKSRDMLISAAIGAALSCIVSILLL